MIDEDDISNAFLFGSIPLLIIVLILYFIFSKPEIEKCHENGGVIIKIEGDSKCIKKDALVEVKKDSK